MNITGFIDDMLKKYGLRDDPRTISEVEEMIGFYHKQYIGAKRIGGPIVAIGGMMATMEDENKNHVSESLSTMSCKKGCSYCCHIEVDITEDEAALINEFCKKRNMRISKKYLKAQLRVPDQERARSKVSACVFLKDNLCIIYPVRPLRCRSHFVQSDPRDCDAKTNIGAKPGKFFNLNAEAMICGVINNSPSGRMAKMLLPYSK